MITNTSEAVNAVKEKLPNGVRVMRRGSHFDIILLTNVFHVKYANEAFHSLGKFFPEWTGEEGESINEESIKHLDNKDHIIFVSPSYMKTIRIDKLKSKAKKRTQRSGEVTYSLPLSYLEDFNGTNN